MPAFESSVLIMAPAEALFALTQDYDRRLLWDPFLSEARLLGGATAAGVGVRAWCVARGTGLGMETEYVSYRPPKATAVEMTRGPWLLKRFAGSWRFEAEGAGTRVTFRYSLVARPALLTRLVAAVFGYEMKQRLAGLKAFAERLQAGG
jgi:ribosome-associated toxin RatA of RatAB toxin-antitoxin module